MPTITIKELHRITGEAVRKAGASKVPTIVTSHGEPVAVITRPSSTRKGKRKRVLLPEFAAMMKRKSKGNVLEDLDAVRGER